MKRSPSQSVRCISCELSCQLFPDAAVRASYCHRAAFAIWPEGNGFLQKELLKNFCLIIKTICRAGLFLWTSLSRTCACLPTRNGLIVWLIAACILF